MQCYDEVIPPKEQRFCTVVKFLKVLQNFLTGILPTKRQVIERLLHEDNFLQLSAAKTVANELVKRWLWCNVYCLHPLTIAKHCKQIQDLIEKFSILDRWSNKKRNQNFLQKVRHFMTEMDKLFDIFCQD